MAGLFLGIGAGPGIGLSTARRFATEGFRVVLAARTVEEVLAKDLRRGANAGVEFASVDCSDSLRVAEFVGRYAPENLRSSTTTPLSSGHSPAARPVGVGSKLRLSHHKSCPWADSVSKAKQP
jgi:hypothetical protein